MSIFTMQDAAHFVGVDIRYLTPGPIISRTPDPATIIGHVANHFDVTEAGLKSHQRSRRIAYPRFVAYWLYSELTGHTLPQIGKIFDRDHTTIMHGIRTVKKWIAEARPLGDEAMLLKTRLEQPVTRILPAVPDPGPPCRRASRLFLFTSVRPPSVAEGQRLSPPHGLEPSAAPTAVNAVSYKRSKTDGPHPILKSGDVT